MLPAAVSMGIAYRDFWSMTPRMLEAVQNGLKERLYFEQQRDNAHAWLQGVYFQHALATVVSKGAKYPREPFTIEQPMSPEEKAIHDRERLRARLSAFAQQHNAKWATEHKSIEKVTD